MAKHDPMNALEAALVILQQAKEPLHYREITRRMLEQRLWHTGGKTPWDTVNARIAVDMKEKGADSVFQRTAPGIYALRAWGMPEFEGKEPKKESGYESVKPIRKMSFADAAEVILERFSEKQPMHYRAITEKILELRLVETKGQTPEATLYAVILEEIKRVTKRGDSPRFVKHGQGYVGLRKWLGQGLAFQIRRHNNEVRKKLHTRLRSMLPDEFEAIVAQLLISLGFEEVEVTKISHDGGIDVRGTLVVGDVIRTRMAVQVKRWKGNVQAPVVQQVRGSLGAHEQGLIITTSDFSQGARKEAARSDAVPVALMSGEQLVEILIENDIGVQRASYDLIELVEAEP